MSVRGLVGVLLLACAVPAAAQSPTTGSIVGKITDSTGSVLQRATVKLSGPALQGVREATTDSEGVYHFYNVPPGRDYKVEASLRGLQTINQANIQIFLGQESTVNLALPPSGVTQDVTVTAASPLLDVTLTSTGVNITANQFQTLPTARNFQQLTTIAPGVTLEMGDHDRRFETSPTVGASSAPENNYIIDGLSATDPRYGTSGANLTMNFVQEVQVLTGGYQAEYGRSTGGVFNVITKSGGNTLMGDLFTYYRNRDWSPGDVERRRNKELVTFADQASDSDFGASLGGPIVKDRLWFFGAIDPGRRTTYLGGQLQSGQLVGPPVSRQYDRNANVYAAKMTWTINPSNNLVVSVFGDPTTRDGWLANPNADQSAAIRLEKTGGHNIAVHYNAVLSSTWLLDASVGRHTQRSLLDPNSDAGRNIPRQIDETIGGYEHGGFQRHQDDQASRNAFGAKFTNIFGDHELRYGVDVEMNNYDGNLHETWYRFFGPSFGFGTYVQERNYSVIGKGNTSNTAAFVQDSWRLGPSLRINAGLRFETQRLGSANKVTISGKSDAEACVVNGECRTVDGLTLGGRMAPRLGFVWDPFKDGRSKVYAFWGRFFEAIPLDMNIRAINGEKYIITQYVNNTELTSSNWYNVNGSPLATNTPWSVRRVSTLTAITPLDEDLQTQYDDQFVVGGERQVGRNLAVGVRFVDRELRRIIEDIGTFTNPADPLELTGYVIGNPSEGFFGAPFEAPTRRYRALEVTVQKSLSNSWHLYSSFVYAKASGNHEGLYISGYDQLDPNITALYDVPSFLPNADGRLRADKPGQFKIHSAYTTKWGLTVSEGLMVSSGVPISAQGPEIVNGYGDGTIFMQQRGSAGRTPTYTNFDFHVDYKIPFVKGGHRSLNVILDVFNLFNNHTVLEADNDYVYEGMDNIAAWEADSNLDAYGNPKYNPALAPSSFFKTPVLFQSPRFVQFGVKFTF
jgi:outer membrane receptor protein involved in Fe transport